MGWSLGKSLTPIGDRILVKLHDRIGQHGSIVIPDEWKRQPQSATVVAVGSGPLSPDGSRRIPIDVAPGDVVALGKWNGVAIPDPDDDQCSIANDPRYYMLESGWQKLRAEGNTSPVAFDDCLFVIEDAAEGPVNEWKVTA